PVSRCVCPQLINTSTLSLHDALPIYIHYMNVVNPTQGMITGSSRFGALFLKKDGSVQVPYNVRLTQKFYDFFGERVQWMSQKQVAYNVSSSYGRRDPTALKIPRFVCVKGIEISHSRSEERRVGKEC